MASIGQNAIVQWVLVVESHGNDFCCSLLLGTLYAYKVMTKHTVYIPVSLVIKVIIEVLVVPTELLADTM